MNKLLLTLTFLTTLILVHAQETVYPAKPQSETIILTDATIHIGNGEIIENGMITFSKGKIVSVKKMPEAPLEVLLNEKLISCQGKHIYPGLITAQTNLGLNEIASTRSTLDFNELGDINTNIRSSIAYNADSKIIGTLRSNGILLANIIPEGGMLSGSSSIMQLDAWNWEDALYKADAGIHFHVPNLAAPHGRAAFIALQSGVPQTDPMKQAFDKIENIRRFFKEANAYFAESKHEHTNLKFEAVKGLFHQQQNFYIHAETVKEMQVGVEFAKEFAFKAVIIGGVDSWICANYLKENNVSVILAQMHSLPLTQDDDVDQPYKTPYLLQQAGVLFAISDDDENSRGRNLMFNAGTAVTYGLTKEEALAAITFNAAKILGIDDKTGTLEKGKDANIIVSDGDILDIKFSNLSAAYIQGRAVSLENKQKQLYERYKYKYGIK